MRILSAAKLKPGDILGKSLFNEQSELLLASGYVLTPQMIALVRNKGFNHVFIMDELSKDIMPEAVITDAVKQATNSRLAKTFEGVKDNLAFEKFAPEEIKKRLQDDDIRAMVKMPAIRKQVEQMLEEIVDNNISMFSSLSTRSDGGESYEHAFNTSVLSILIGREFKYDQQELRSIGSAAMLHDIGKMAFGDLNEKKPSELNRDEKMLLREHPVYSMLILQGSEPEAFVEQTAVFQHHEQENGKGYPQGLKGFGKPPIKNRGHDKGYIYRMAEILGVANTYDNLTSGTYDGIMRTPEDAITALVNKEAGYWNESVVHALTKVVECYPVGSTVIIKSNYSNSHIDYSGIVAKLNPEDQSKPIIILTHNSVGGNITPHKVDFCDERFMTIELNL
ncbi:MAG: HD domain-containing protein [Candidatus Electryonea clarkiae]|nr:HD domain-containing protein [Candidatus Electryonea clarkiae]MDP8289076.1 HD domain-containing protein [Candidatus Electryonea clarkiae]